MLCQRSRVCQVTWIFNNIRYSRLLFCFQSPPFPARPISIRLRQKERDKFGDLDAVQLVTTIAESKIFPRAVITIRALPDAGDKLIPEKERNTVQNVVQPSLRSFGSIEFARQKTRNVSKAREAEGVAGLTIQHGSNNSTYNVSHECV